VYGVQFEMPTGSYDNMLAVLIKKYKGAKRSWYLLGLTIFHQITPSPSLFPGLLGYQLKEAQ